MLTTYYNNTELDKMTSVSNRDVNDLFQEVRKKVTDRLFIRERKEITKRFMRKPIERTVLSAVYVLDGKSTFINNGKELPGKMYEVQELMHLSGVTFGQMFSYLAGMLNGYESREKQEEERRSKYGI